MIDSNKIQLILDIFVSLSDVERELALDVLIKYHNIEWENKYGKSVDNSSLDW